MENSKKLNRLFLIVFVIAIILSVGFTFYKTVIKGNFEVIEEEYGEEEELVDDLEMESNEFLEEEVESETEAEVEATSSTTIEIL